MAHETTAAAAHEPMNIHCIGINHRTAPVEVREKLWFSPAEVGPALTELARRGMKEAVLVSTCNRTELYYVSGREWMNGEPLWRFLARLRNVEAAFEPTHFYALASTFVLKHLFAVASGIDSMVLGDVQILNQMKEGFTTAQDLRTTGIVLNRMFHAAFHVGKRVRTETEIGEGAVSVSYAAAELASKIFEDLSKRTALLVGAGDTGQLTAKHLTGRKLGNLVVANRTRKHAEELSAALGGRVIDFEAIALELPRVDIVISAVDAPKPILAEAEIRRTMRARGNRPLVIIDIGVPRNIDPAANTIDNVFLHDIDALNHIIDHNLERRKAEVPKIQRIILEELVRFSAWYSSLDVTPTIQDLREQFETIRTSEVERSLHRLPPDAREEIDILTKRIVNKILHTPMVNLRNGSSDTGEEETRTKVHILRHLFGLDKKSHSS